jgi:hypothetical protein
MFSHAVASQLGEEIKIGCGSRLRDAAPSVMRKVLGCPRSLVCVRTLSLVAGKRQPGQPEKHPLH